MTFKELKRLAREKSISQCWTNKREAVNHLMCVEQEDLNMVAVTVVDSSHLPKKPRFPKPRMTVFQLDKDDSSLSAAEFSHKGYQKYFATPSAVREGKANENSRCSALESAIDVVSSRKNSLTPAGTVKVRGVSLHDLRRPLTRSYKNQLMHMDLSEGGEECNPVAGETTHSSEKRNSNSGEMSEDIKLNKSVPVSGTTEVLKKELKCTVSCGREQQMNFFAREMRVTLDARMKDACLTFKPEARIDSFADAEESSPKCNLNETFQIKTETTEVTPPLRMQSCNRTSTPDDTDDKENEISNYCSMDTTFDLPCQSNVCNVEDNKSGRRKGSFSYPYEGTDKESLSKALVLSQTPKLPTSSASHLHSARDELVKGTKIPKLVKKMPDFTTIHQRQFEKMESVVDCHQRKLDRAKMLLCSKTTQVVQPGTPFTIQLSATKQAPSSKIMTQNSVHRTYQTTGNVPQRPAGDKNVLQHTKAYNRQLFQQHDVKEMVVKKVASRKIQRMREETRTVIRGVRLNKRFELQMAHRRMN